MLKQLKMSVANISLPWLIFTLMVFIGLVKLGFWQSDRAKEKELRLAKMVEIQQQKPLSLTQVLQLKQQQSDDKYINDFPVRIKGKFISDVIFLLDNQTNAGALGYRVYQVLQANKLAVLINLGWVQGSINRDELPQLTHLTGEYEFTGHVRLVEEGMKLMEQNFNQVTWPFRVQTIELDKFSSLINIKLLPFVVYLDKNETIGYKKNWQPIVMPPEKHRAYAFQWFSLAFAWLVLMTWASYKFNKNIHT